MRVLRRIWDDIRHGENIDLYSTVLISLALSVLNVMGIASPSSIALITLASLVILVVFALKGFRGRAVQRKLKLQRLMEKEKDFFLKVNEDTSMLLNKGSRQYVE